MNIGPVDPEMALLKLKKERNYGRQNIAWSAGLPSGLNKLHYKQSHTVQRESQEYIDKATVEVDLSENVVDGS